jgi:hypothetical protein
MSNAARQFADRDHDGSLVGDSAVSTNSCTEQTVYADVTVKF